MTELNIPAIAGAAFLGFLALAALLFLFAPVTRFLGDLFCCPWRVPFTRKKRRNGDEEVDKEDLPYWSERRLESPVNGTANKSISADYVMVGRWSLTLHFEIWLPQLTTTRARAHAIMRRLESHMGMIHDTLKIARRWKLVIMAERMGEHIGPHTMMLNAVPRGRTVGIGGDHAQTSTLSTRNKPRMCITRAITTRMRTTTATTKRHFQARKFNGLGHPTLLQRSYLINTPLTTFRGYKMSTIANTEDNDSPTQVKTWQVKLRD